MDFLFFLAEMLSLLVILMLVLEILYNCRPLIVSMWRKTHAYKHKIKALIPWAKQEQKVLHFNSLPHNLDFYLE